jgi:hypothetical protein
MERRTWEFCLGDLRRFGRTKDVLGTSSADTRQSSGFGGLREGDGDATGEDDLTRSVVV